MSAPRGSPWSLLPREGLCKAPPAFQGGAVVTSPQRWRCVWGGDEISLVGARGPGENSQQVLFIETVNKGDWPARGLVTG